MPLRARRSAQTLARRMTWRGVLGGGGMMHPELRLYEDVLPNGGEAALPALPRMIFVVHGSLAVADRTLSDGEAWSGESAVMLKGGRAGATVWRWELVAGNGGGGLGAWTGIGSG